MNNLIFIDEGEEIEANSFTVDVFIEDDKKIICVELKSVKPNAGEMRGEKQKILEGKSALYHTYKDKRIEYFIGFPFDPTSLEDTSSDKERFLNSIIDGEKYYDYAEVLLAEELWDFLSSENNTMQQILEIINSIAKPSFIDNYNTLNNPSIELSIKKEILKKWNIISELKLIDNNEIILNKIENDTKLKRVYRKSIFKKGNYNHQRFTDLNALLYK